MTIRKFKKEDATKVSNLIRKCLKEVNSKDYSKNIINFMCSYFTSGKVEENAKNRDVYVIIEKNKLLGTGALKDNIILSVFIHPKAHRKGIGTKLMNYIEKKARDRKYEFVKVPASITAVGFYKKRGYKKIGEKYIKKFGKNIIMRKRV